MKYKNPVLKGFYPDPSVCIANGRYYMVCSSFQYFPGVPLFESSDLVNWNQIGHVLTRKDQVMLDKINSSGGIFAPTIRFDGKRFYMVTTNDTTHQNFYVYTDNIYGEWSAPVFVDQGGIDPSLFFEDGRTYFMSNGIDSRGRSGVIQCEIDIANGKKLTESKCIWQGSGGRFLESPHMYKINDYYYLMAAEGGTEYGHMITYARSRTVWGDFENYPQNPVLTNRNKAPFIIQGIGHGDLVYDKHGDWHILSLGFRQSGLWMPYHHLGREVFLTPISFDEQGWFSARVDGTTDESYEIHGEFYQNEKKRYTFENTKWNIDWCYLRHPNKNSYELYENKAVLHGCEITLDDADSPTFIGLRQRDFCGEISCKIDIDFGEAGITLYMNESEHYDIAIKKIEENTEIFLKLNIGGVKHIQKAISLNISEAELIIRMDNMSYNFFVRNDNKECYLGSAQTKYLSSEVSGGFTGVVIGLYAVGGNRAVFKDFRCEYE